MYAPFRASWAVAAMVGSWTLAAVYASLPIAFNLSSYSVTSTCLPLRADSAAERAYLLAGLSVYFVSFLVISASYIRLFRLVRGNGEHSEDVAVAKKMFLLIATDALCWAPTLFYGKLTFDSLKTVQASRPCSATRSSPSRQPRCCSCSSSPSTR